MGLSSMLALLSVGCSPATCPEGTVPADGGQCIRPAEGCPTGYAPTDDGACLWTGSDTTTATGTDETSSSGSTTGTTTTTPSTSETGDTGLPTTTEPLEGPGVVHWVGLRRFEFLVAPSAAAGPGRWEDGTLHPMQLSILFADHEHLESGFEPGVGFACEVTFASTTDVPPIIGSWVSDGDATVGYEIPPDATVANDTCSGRIHAEFADYMTILEGTTLGVGLHDLSPSEQKKLAAAIPAWPAIRDWTLGSGWHLGQLDGTTALSAYSKNGYAIGHEVDAKGTVLLDGAGQPMPQDRDLTMPPGAFPNSAWYSGEVFMFWPVDALFD